jgi:hypothetical protein
MIFLKVLVNIPLLLSNLFTQIERAVIILQDLSVASVRTEDGFVVGDYQLKDRGNDSYDKAKEIYFYYLLSPWAYKKLAFTILYIFL